MKQLSGITKIKIPTGKLYIMSLCVWAYRMEFIEESKCQIIAKIQTQLLISLNRI